MIYQLCLIYLNSLREERYVTFFIAKKVTKKSSRSKNSLSGSVFILVVWFAFSLILVSFSVSFICCFL